jgi:hypothetical protein
MDELYEQMIVRTGFYDGACAIAAWFDTNIEDGAVNGRSIVARRTGVALRWVQSGSVQAYGTVGFTGLMVASVLMLVWVER